MRALSTLLAASFLALFSTGQLDAHRFADPLGAARHERPAAIEFEMVAHPRISSEAILLPSSPKTNRRLTGLPGKFPEMRLVTTVLPSF